MEGTLADLAEAEMGQSPPGETCNRIGHGIPLLNGPTEFGPYHPTTAQWTTSPARMARVNDILFCVRGSTTGRMNWADQDYAIGRGLAAIRHKAGKELQSFLRAVIELGLADLLAAATGSTFPNVSQEQILSMPVRVPPLDDQRIISAVLGPLDDKIELNRQMNHTLEEMAHAIFKSWFVDFDPIVAKVAGPRPFGMDDETAALFPAGFEESEFGPIPHGWSVDSVYSVADVVYGAPFASQRFNGEKRGLPLLRIRDLSTHNPEVHTDEVHSKGTRIKPGDIVVGMDGEFRAHFWRGPESWLNQRVCLFVPSPPASRAFIYYSIIEPLAEFERSKVGTTVSHLGKSDIDTVKLILPPSEVLKAFGRLTEPFIERSIANGAESQALAVLRDFLVPKLLSGEIRVKQAEKVVGGPV